MIHHVESNNMDRTAVKLTLCKHAVHVEPVGGAGLVKQRVTHIDAQLPRSLVLDHTRVCATDFI